MTRLALLRHADTAWSREGRIQGQTDVPLLKNISVSLPEACRGMRVVTSPLARCVQTATYPLRVQDQDSAASAELLAIMVDPAWRSQGIGAALIAALLDACRTREIARLDVTVDAANLGAQRFYERHGFLPHRRFTLYGRAMMHYRLTLDRA